MSRAQRGCHLGPEGPLKTVVHDGCILSENIATASGLRIKCSNLYKVCHARGQK